jgi:hypothetical protein
MYSLCSLCVFFRGNQAELIKKATAAFKCYKLRHRPLKKGRKTVDPDLEHYAKFCKNTMEWWSETRDLVARFPEENDSVGAQTALCDRLHTADLVLEMEFQLTKHTPSWGKTSQPLSTNSLRRLAHQVVGFVDHRYPRSDKRRNMTYICDERCADGFSSNAGLSMLDHLVEVRRQVFLQDADMRAVFAGGSPQRSSVYTLRRLTLIMNEFIPISVKQLLNWAARKVCRTLCSEMVTRDECRFCLTSPGTQEALVGAYLLPHHAHL